MASFISNGAKSVISKAFFRQEEDTFTGFKIALINANGVGSGTAVTPTPANCKNFSDCEANEIPAGNGYATGGQPILRNATYWPVFSEDDGNNRSIIGLNSITWTASGGNLPASGGGAAYAVLYIDNNTTRDVIMVLDLQGSRTVSDSQQLILKNIQFIMN